MNLFTRLTNNFLSDSPSKDSLERELRRFNLTETVPLLPCIDKALEEAYDRLLKQRLDGLVMGVRIVRGGGVWTSSPIDYSLDQSNSNVYSIKFSSIYGSLLRDQEQVTPGNFLKKKSRDSR